VTRRDQSRKARGRRGTVRAGTTSVKGRPSLVRVVAIGAFFDLDKTIIAKSSLLAFSGTLYREGLLSRRMIVRNAYAQVVFMLVGADDNKMEKLRVITLELIRGWERDHVAAIVRETLEQVITPIVFAEARELIAMHQTEGHRVVIVSSAPDEVVRPLGTFLGVDDVIATRAAVDDEGLYTGELAFYAYGPHKAEGMRALAAAEGIDLAASYAYSDSCTDEPMLRAVGHPFAVNPDRELARVAHEEGWPILSFARPVRLRDRVRHPEPSPGLVVSGAVAAGGALVVWWWLRQRDRPRD
jgi:HAD superfamily hydrolase (TIGR01490 family)